jgi:DNA-binding CsgD family transcriptional regulator
MVDLDFVSDPEVLARSWRKEIEAVGAVRASYHLTPAFCSQIGSDMILHSFGFPEAWLEKYADPAFRENDPIPDFTMRHGRAITWSAIIGQLQLSRGQREFWDTFRSFGLPDGISIPLFGPNGREAYFAFSLDRDITHDDRSIVERVIKISQANHCKTVNLVARNYKPSIAFSKREKEVLNLMALGYANSEIGVALNIATPTVATFVRRIFAKLEVHDRISAVVGGFDKGLLNL